MLTRITVGTYLYHTIGYGRPRSHLSVVIGCSDKEIHIPQMILRHIKGGFCQKWKSNQNKS